MPFRRRCRHARSGRRTGIQEQVTDIGQFAAGFHNNWLLALCLSSAWWFWSCWPLRCSIPSRCQPYAIADLAQHGARGRIWTLIPVLILVAIAIPSMRLLQTQYKPAARPTLTVKVTGNQWYWTYHYPDNGGFEIVSNMLKEKADVAGRAFPYRCRRPAASCRRRAHGPPGRQGHQVPGHLDRRDPRFGFRPSGPRSTPIPAG